MKKTTAEKIKERTVKTNGCWFWVGSINAYGYGSVIDEKKIRPAHRVVFEMNHGRIPESLVIDHKCRNRSCVNPQHLRAVTKRINAIENSNSVAAININKTHCIYGHEFSQENTTIFFSNGLPKRRCLMCYYRKAREYCKKVKKQK